MTDKKAYHGDFVSKMINLKKKKNELVIKRTD